MWNSSPAFEAHLVGALAGSAIGGRLSILAYPSHAWGLRILLECIGAALVIAMSIQTETSKINLRQVLLQFIDPLGPNDDRGDKRFGENHAQRHRGHAGFMNLGAGGFAIHSTGWSSPP